MGKPKTARKPYRLHSKDLQDHTNAVIFATLLPLPNIPPTKARQCLTMTIPAKKTIIITSYPTGETGIQYAAKNSPPYRHYLLRL